MALLRGINVLGRNKVSMPALSDVVASLGYAEVATYIQSGNVVFAARDPDATCDDIAGALEAAIAAELGLRPAVVVLTRSELGDVVSDNPFPHVRDHKTLHGVFLRQPPDVAGTFAVVAAVERAKEKGSRDDARVVGRTLYLWTPDGFARSALRAELSRAGRHRTPMAEGTARNWATVHALRSLLGD